MLPELGMLRQTCRRSPTFRRAFVRAVIEGAGYNLIGVTSAPAGIDLMFKAVSRLALLGIGIRPRCCPDRCSTDVAVGRG